MKKVIKNKKGFVALVAVLVITSVALSIAISISLSAVREIQMSFSQSQSQKAFTYAEACVEEALNKLRVNWIDNSGDLTFEEGTEDHVCEYEVLVDLGDGRDGDLEVSSDYEVNNVKTTLSAGNYAFNTNIITVSDSTGFSEDDLILIIQMQDDDITDTNTAGQYEFAKISSINGNDFTLDSLNNTYNQDTSVNDRVQVLKVPQYENVTVSFGSLTASDWDGSTGGIVVFKARGTVTGTINADGAGYEGGGCGTCSNKDWGEWGEGITGEGAGGSTMPESYDDSDSKDVKTYIDSGSNGGAGGYGVNGYGGTSGAGGSNATSGEDGYSWRTASEAGEAVSGEGKLIFGGGGGGGGDADDINPPPIGGDGGGIVLVYANDLNNLTVSAKGTNGGVSNEKEGGGAGGSGAGGSIYLWARTSSEVTTDISGGDRIYNYNVDGGVIIEKYYAGAGGDGKSSVVEGGDSSAESAIINVTGFINSDAGSYTRNISIQVDNEMNILSWQEVSN